MEKLVTVIVGKERNWSQIGKEKQNKVEHDTSKCRFLVHHVLNYDRPDAMG